VSESGHTLSDVRKGRYGRRRNLPSCWAPACNARSVALARWLAEEGSYVSRYYCDYHIRKYAKEHGLEWPPPRHTFTKEDA
jgi:hypothetical protein